MAEDPLMEPKEESQELETPKNLKRKSPEKLHEYEKHSALKEARKIKGVLLANNKPSYCLKQGIGSFLCGGESLRSQHRKRLWWLLKKLMRSHNWVEASGVLSVLLQGTGRDQTLSRNRAKYSAALQLLKYIKGETISSRKIQSVYELWMKKLGPLKNWSPKDRFAVQLEFILTCLQDGSTGDAYQAALCIMQERGFDSDSVSNLVVGLAFCQLWYTGIPKELQLTELDSSNTPQSEVHVDVNHMPIDYSKGNDAFEAAGGSSHSQSGSYSSIANDKELPEDDDKKPMDVDDDVKKEISLPEENEHSDQSLPDHNYNGDLPHASIFDTQGLPPWLLPIKLPTFHEDLEDAISTHQKLLDNHYKSALKHLRAALYSTPPVIEAFHPLIQMLLLGDHVYEAFDEFENLFHTSDTVLQLRLKAGLLEKFDVGNYVKLCTCVEDILKKDPTCSVSLTKLVNMHKCGDYDTQNLVEMIALHLDATHGTCDTWNELASCILKLSQCKEDRASTCYDGSDRCSQECLDNSTKIPDFFTRGESEKSWRLRSRWWLNRHFHNRNLASDISSGDLKLLTCKAAVASHIYGRHFKYVVKATECLEKENDMELFSFLQTHILNSIGFYFVKT